jgi:hypothetical protein
MRAGERDQLSRLALMAGFRLNRATEHRLRPLTT